MIVIVTQQPNILYPEDCQDDDLLCPKPGVGEVSHGDKCVPLSSQWQLPVVSPRSVTHLGSARVVTPTSLPSQPGPRPALADRMQDHSAENISFSLLTCPDTGQLNLLLVIGLSLSAVRRVEKQS